MINNKIKSGLDITEQFIIMGLSCISFLITLDMMSINLILPTLATEYRTDIHHLSYILTGFTLTSLIFVVPFGRLGDLLGIKRLYLLGVFIFAATSVSIMLSNNITAIMFWRIIQGLGYALIASMSNVMVLRYISSENTGKSLGIINSCSALSAVLGPALIGIVITYLSWRWVFLFNVPFCTLSIYLIIRYCKGDNIFAFPKLNYSSFLLWFGVVLSSYYFINNIQNPTALTYASIMASILLLYTLILSEKRSEFPTIDFSIFRDPIYNFVNISRLIVSYSSYTLLFLVVLYLQNIQGYSPITTGIIFLDVSVAMVVSAIISGYLIDKFGPYEILIGISISLIVSFVFSAFPHVKIGITEYLVYFIMGISFGAIRPCLSFILIKRISENLEGVENAISATMLPIGGLLGVSLSTFILERTSEFILYKYVLSQEVSMDIKTMSILKDLATGVLPFSDPHISQISTRLIIIAKEAFQQGYMYNMLFCASLFSAMLIFAVYSMIKDNESKSMLGLRENG